MDPTEAAKTVTVAEALEAAVAHHRAGRLAAAREFYRAILEVQPKNFNALHLLGALSRRQGAAAAAVRLITEALAIDGSFAPAYANLSGALLDHGRIDEAVKAGRTALTLNPGELEAGRSLLRCLLYLPGLDPEQRLAAHRDFAARHQPRPSARCRRPPTIARPNAGCASACCRRICGRIRSGAICCRCCAIAIAPPASSSPMPSSRSRTRSMRRFASCATAGARPPIWTIARSRS
jgi:tetratricopeptide (TPR) repeat protein